MTHGTKLKLAELILSKIIKIRYRIDTMPRIEGVRTKIQLTT